MMTKVETPSVQGNLVGLLEGLFATLGPDISVDGVHPVICQTLEQAKKMVTGLTGLMNPQVGYLQISLEDILELVSAKEEGTLVATCKLHLDETFWQKKIDEIVRPGKKRLQDIQEVITKSLSELSSFSKKEIFFAVPDFFHTLTKEYVGMKKDCRSGQMKELDTFFKICAVKIANFLVGLEQVGDFSQEDIKCVLSALGYFAKDIGITDVIKKLGQWEGSQAKALGKARLENILKRTASIKFKNVTEVYTMLQQLNLNEVASQDVSETALQNLQKILFNLMEEWQREAMGIRNVFFLTGQSPIENAGLHRVETWFCLVFVFCVRHGLYRHKLDVFDTCF